MVRPEFELCFIKHIFQTIIPAVPDMVAVARRNGLELQLLSGGPQLAVHHLHAAMLAGPHGGVAGPQVAPHQGAVHHLDAPMLAGPHGGPRHVAAPMINGLGSLHLMLLLLACLLGISSLHKLLYITFLLCLVDLGLLYWFLTSVQTKLIWSLSLKLGWTTRSVWSQWEGAWMDLVLYCQ
jgi:hypothetical protein